MYLSSQVLQWAIKTLRINCHPFIGITFLAGKRANLPVGTTTEMRLDSVTKSHLVKHHRLDPNSEFFFQPFKSKKQMYWVTASYPSSGLQAINTQTFNDAFVHPKYTRKWGMSEGYIDKISHRIKEAKGHEPASLAAMAIWVGKDELWDSNTGIDTIILRFREKFNLYEEEVTKLFDTSIVPPRAMTLIDEESLDLKVVAYNFAPPPDAPSQTEGTLKTICLTNVGPAKEFYLELGERLTLIAGDNGLGKSFLLDAAWWALTSTWAGYPAQVFQYAHSVTPRIEHTIKNLTGQEILGTSQFDWKNHSWSYTNNRPSVAALSIYARADGSFAIADETRGQLHADGPKSLSLFTSNEVWEGKPGEIEGLIRDWVTWQLSSDRGPFTMLSRLLEHLSPDDIGPLEPSEPIRIPGDPRHIPTIKHVYGEVPVLFTSAGIQRILLLAYLIIWSWQEHLLASEQSGITPQRKMVILVDELEAHLHPKWQRLVLPALMSIGKFLSEKIEIQVIAATHSPMVLASIEDEFSEESDLLAHLSLMDGNVILEQLDFYKYGDISSWLMSPVFGLPHARSRAAESIIEDAKSLQLSDKPSLEEVRRVTLRLKKTLSPDDIFWSRWIYFARELGDEI